MVRRTDFSLTSTRERVWFTSQTVHCQICLSNCTCLLMSHGYCPMHHYSAWLNITASSETTVCYSTLCRAVLYCILLYCTGLDWTGLYCTLLYLLYCTLMWSDVMCKQKQLIIEHSLPWHSFDHNREGTSVKSHPTSNWTTGSVWTSCMQIYYIADKLPCSHWH